jgi:TonB-linked SusC/RagA family outer membrane protein
MLKILLSFLQKKKKALVFIFFLFFSLFSFSQQKTSINCRVLTADDNTPLSGVSVNVKGSASGTVTDAEGRFAMQAAKGDVLIFSSVGYEEKQVKIINERSAINVPMISTSSTLGEVVVVGYGAQRKRDVTAAVSTIDVSKLKDIPAANVSRLLQGQASGVTVKQVTGAPGREFEVTIRGTGSLGAGSQPLYVVDGFPVGTSIGQNLNPNDIATITILKDAVSTAIYGARGSNGVVLITTKKAKNGEVSLTATANYGIQNIPESRKTKVLNGVDFAQFKKDIFMDKIRAFENREPAITEVPLDFRYPEQTKYNTNWFDAILNQNAKFQNYNITLAEGKGDIHSLVSVGYVGQEGALIKTNYENFSVRANIDGKVNNFITMGLNINGSYSRQNTANTEGRANLVGSTLLMDPRQPIYNAEGSYNSYIGGVEGIFGFPNPVQSLNQVKRNREITDVLSNGFLEFSLTKNLKFKTAVNSRLISNSYKEFVPSTMAGVNAPPPRDATEYDENFRTMNLSADELLTYTNNIGDHHVEVLAGYTAQQETTKGLSGSGNQYPNDLVPFLNSAVIRSSGSTEYGWSMQAYFGRLNYSFKGRYLFSGTFRREGSSRFGAKNKWGDFPAVSAGWRISDEPFMPKITWLNDLKIRGSYGITGNNNIGNYSSLAFMNTSNYVLGNNFVSGQVVSSFANTELGWEKSKQTDIGLDLSAFNNKLTFTAEYYKRITSNMLLSISLPAISGFTSSLGNVGKVQNQGYEFAVGYKTKINTVNLWSNFNISFNRNKVLEIRGQNDEIWNGSFYGDYNVSKVGRPIGMIYGYKVLGIFQSQDEIAKSPTQDGAIPGVYKYFDADGNGKISYDTKDMIEIGNPWPKATYGLTLGGSYKNVDLSVLFTGAQGYDVFRQIESSTMNMDGVFNVLEASKERWRSAQNPGSGKYATTNTWKWERESNSRYVYSGSHMWVKNVSIGYSIPKTTLHFSSIRVYASADNLFLFSNYPGNNPDVNNSGGINPGLDDESYPISRTFSIGANLNF